MKQELGKQIFDIATPIARALSLELIDVSCLGKGARSLIRVTIDKRGGVSIQDCEKFHQSLGRALDVADPVPHAYQLEVSSPGLDRPLKTVQDYQRIVGDVVRVKLRAPREGKWVCVGRVHNATERGIELLTDTGKERMLIELPWELIAEGKLEIEM